MKTSNFRSQIKNYPKLVVWKFSKIVSAVPVRIFATKKALDLKALLNPSKVHGELPIVRLE